MPGSSSILQGSAGKIGSDTGVQISRRSLGMITGTCCCNSFFFCLASGAVSGLHLAGQGPCMPKLPLADGSTQEFKKPGP